MATSKNTSTNTLTNDAGKQLREMSDQLAIFSDVLDCAFEAVSSGDGNRDERTVAAFAISRTSAELSGFSQSLYGMTEKGVAESPRVS